MTEATDKIDELCKSMNVTRKELAQMKAHLTSWVDPDVDEDKFLRQCVAVAEIDPKWLGVYLTRQREKRQELQEQNASELDARHCRSCGATYDG